MNIDKQEIANEEATIAPGTGVFKLKKSIDINGEKVSEMKYNFEDMTAKNKQRATIAYKKAGNGMGMQEFDPDYHLYLFATAVAKENPSIDTNDIFRMSAKDAVRAGNLVRDFFFLSSED